MELINRRKTTSASYIDFGECEPYYLKQKPTRLPTMTGLICYKCAVHIRTSIKFNNLKNCSIRTTFISQICTISGPQTPIVTCKKDTIPISYNTYTNKGVLPVFLPLAYLGGLLRVLSYLSRVAMAIQTYIAQETKMGVPFFPTLQEHFIGGFREKVL